MNPVLRQRNRLRLPDLARVIGDSRLTDNYLETGLGNAVRGPQTVPAKVKPVSPHHRFVIALHSPETGLRMCSPEKSRDRSPLCDEQCVLCGPVYM
jgi:hypothetical protein